MSAGQAPGDHARQRLVATGRRLFAECGFADAPLPVILRQADVTRDEFFAHFPDKRALFRAVFDQFEDDLAERVAAVSPYPDRSLSDRVSAGLPEPTDVKRTVLGIPQGVLDIAFALGPDPREERTWEDLAEDYVHMLRDAILENLANGYITDRRAEPLARLLLAGINASIAAADKNGEVIDYGSVKSMVVVTDLHARGIRGPSRKQRLLERLWSLAETRFLDTWAGSWPVREGNARTQVFAFTRDAEHALQTLLEAVPIAADVDLRCRAQAAQYTQTELVDTFGCLQDLSKHSDGTGAIIKDARLQVERNRVRVCVYASAERASEVLSRHVDMGTVEICPELRPPDG